MMRRFVSAVLIVVALAGAAYWNFAVRPFRDPHPAPFVAHGAVAIEHATVIPSPDAEPLTDVTVLTRDGTITAVSTNVPVPADARRIPCNGCTVTAGFWNVHVHFTEPKWSDAATGDASALEHALADFALSHGVTTVVDLGSDLRTTLALRRRIEHGEVRGPTILTAGASQYPPDGIPYYLADLPWFIRAMMPQPATPEAARRITEQNIAHGADVLKLFTGSLIAHNVVKPMELDVVRAATSVARAHGQLSFAHPSNAAGMRIAIDGGVNVLAHAPSEPSGVDSAMLARAIAGHVAMVPTLKMFATTVTRDSAFLDPIVAIVRRWHALGGPLLFGTDVGYMKDYSLDEEFQLLARAGLGGRDILRMLTVAPAERVTPGAKAGRVMPGYRADLVVLDGDPIRNVQALTRVRAVVRAGAVAWEAAR